MSSSSFQEISLGDPIPTYGTITQGKGLNEVLVKLELDEKISETAKTIFGNHYEQLFANIQAYHIALQSEIDQKAEFEKTWTYWVYKNNVNLRLSQGLISGVTATGLLIDLALEGPSIAKGVFITAFMGLSILSCIPWKANLPAFAFLKWDQADEEMKRLNASITHVEHNLKATENLHSLAVQIAEFISAWKKFEKNPIEEDIGNLFLLLESMEVKCVEFNKTCTLSVDSFYRNTSSIINKDVFLNKGLNRLLLMDQICDKLKKGKVFSAWKTLKIAKNGLWNNPKAEPWNSLKMVNPDREAYRALFTLKTETKITTTLAENWENLFASFFA